jgi:lipopolysaccharide/colanic/teichoic acid biosynthesis glycosyltransferase
VLARRVSEQLSACCLELPVSYIGANEFFEQLFAHVPLGTVDATWFEYVLHPRYRTSSPALKRVLSLTLAVIMLALSLPVLALAAVAIKLTDGGPVLYRQRRAGERGREFDVLKLRTMSAGSDRDTSRWSPPDDDRITRVGAVLRRLHIDELPQLWNVIRGEMALVGPRPERPDLVAMLEMRLPFYGRRHLMRPGITGWAQVRCGYSGSVTGSLWKLAHDLYYLKHRSILFDFLILLETIATPVRDGRMARRSPDELFVLEALREEDEAGTPSAPEQDLGIEVPRRRFRPDRAPAHMA